MKFKALLCITVILTYYQGNAQVRPRPLDEKVQQLADMVAKKSIINLNLSKFKEYVKSPPKDYSFIVMFTAMAPARRCAICQHVYDEYLIVANSFRYSPSFNNKLFFGMVDFDEGSDIFQMLRLNTAPVIMHFPAKGKPKPADSMDFERAGIQAEAIAKWIQDRTDVQIRVFRPPNYSGAVAFTLLFTLIGGFLYLRRNNLEFLYNKDMWAAMAVGFCFTMVSGQMWNQIRGPPFFHRTKNGPVYINGGSHGQFVLESYIVAVLNAAVVVGMVIIIEAAGGVQNKEARPQEGKRRRFQSVVGLVLVCVFFSLLLSVFRTKTQGYPYSVRKRPSNCKRCRLKVQYLIKLDACNFNKYVLTTEKDYSFIVLFRSPNTEDQSDNSGQIYKQYVEVAKSKTALGLKNALFFGVVDVGEPEVFEAARNLYFRDTGTLITKHHPVIMHFPQLDVLNSSDCIDLENIGTEEIGDKILSFIKIRGGMSSNVENNIIFHLWYDTLWLLHDKNFWASFIVGFCIMNVAGENWTAMHDVGWFYTDDEDVHIIVKGNGQSAFECYCVMVLILASVFGMLLVIESLANTKYNIKYKSITRNTRTIVGTILTFGSVLCLMSMLHSKYT